MNLISKYCRDSFDSYEDFYNNFKITAPENFNFAYDVVDEIANGEPDQMALVWCNDKGDEKTFTFGEMKTLSNKAANAFTNRGIKKGDKVLLILKRHWHYWVAMMALCKIGAVAIPATHMLTSKDFAYRIEAADISSIIMCADEGVIKELLEAEKKISVKLKAKFTVFEEVPGFFFFDKEMKAASGDFPRKAGDEGTQNEDMMLMYFTSGTTGMPKMVVHNFLYPLGHILTARFWHDLSDTDLHLSVADTGWAKCSWGKLYGQWLSGAAVFVYDYADKFKPVDLLEVVAKYKVTVFCAPPTIFRFLIKEDLSAYDLSSLRHCCTAGEPLNPEVFNRWKEITGLEIKEGFGQSETAVIMATFKWVETRPGSTGKPSPHYPVKIIMENGAQADPGDEGELCIDISHGMPEGLTVGYYADEERTKALFANGLFHTGDVVWADEDGYIWFVGRSDDVIKSSGYRIGPFEVESALLEHPAVLEAAITALPDPIRGQIVKATVVLVKGRGYEPSDELVLELQEHVKHTTAPYKYPRVIEFVDELPKTISGKIKRAEIRKETKAK